MRIQCHIGAGVQAVPPVVARAAPVHVLPATRPARAKHRKLPGYTALAGAALSAVAGCASFDAKIVQAWAIEPVVSVIDSVQSSQAFYAMGRYFDGSQAWDRAIDAYRKAIAADAQNVEAYNALGVALAQSGRLAQAEVALRQAIALAPNLGHVRSNLGYVLMLAGRPGEAVKELKVAVKQDESNVMAMANLRDALALSDASRYGVVTATTPSKNAKTLAAVDAAEVAVLPRKPGGGLELTEGAPMMISVPAPIVSAELPTPLAASVSVPVELQTASVPAPQGTAAVASVTPIATPTVAPLTLRVVDKPTVASLVERATGTTRAPLAQAQTVSLRAPTLPATPERALRLEVSNGNGVAGMAARVGRWLATQGVQTERLTNQQPFRQQQTVIQYRSGHEEAALHVARSLPANAKAQAMPTQGLRSDVRVVLGRDWVRTAACLGPDTCRPTPTTVAAATKP